MKWEKKPALNGIISWQKECSQLHLSCKISIGSKTVFQSSISNFKYYVCRIHFQRTCKRCTCQENGGKMLEFIVENTFKYFYKVLSKFAFVNASKFCEKVTSLRKKKLKSYRKEEEKINEKSEIEVIENRSENGWSSRTHLK